MEDQVKQLFVDFINNKCTTEEKMQVLAFIKTGCYEEEWEEAMKYAGHEDTGTGSLLLYPFNEEKLYQRIKRKVGLHKRQHSVVKWSIAASVLLGFMVGLYFISKPVKTRGQLNAQNVTIRRKPPVITNHNWIKLTDGTSVQLNNNSHLYYPNSFAGEKNREVTLIGEAYFDVKHDADHPFIIHTGKITTTVLGTAFNISAYKANTAVTVTVSRGRVKVQDAEKTLAILTPNEQISWTQEAKTPDKQVVDAKLVTAWKANDLIMDDITLEEASGMIAQRYGVKIYFKNDKVKACRFTAAFLNRNQIAQVLSVLSDITGASLVLKNGVVTIDGPGC